MWHIDFCFIPKEWAENGKRLDARRPVLLNKLRHVSNILRSERTPHRVDLQLDGATCAMNAGFVKIYSVLLDSCVIYDGRVGAALGLLVGLYCREQALPQVPKALHFAYGAPKEAVKAKNPKVRNPSAGPYTFPKLRPDSHMQTDHTMRSGARHPVAGSYLRR